MPIDIPSIFGPARVDLSTLAGRTVHELDVYEQELFVDASVALLRIAFAWGHAARGKELVKTTAVPQHLGRQQYLVFAAVWNPPASVGEQRPAVSVEAMPVGWWLPRPMHNIVSSCAHKARMRGESRAHIVLERALRPQQQLVRIDEERMRVAPQQPRQYQWCLVHVIIYAKGSVPLTPTGIAAHKHFPQITS